MTEIVAWISKAVLKLRPTLVIGDESKVFLLPTLLNSETISIVRESHVGRRCCAHAPCAFGNLRGALSSLPIALHVQTAIGTRLPSFPDNDLDLRCYACASYRVVDLRSALILLPLSL